MRTKVFFKGRFLVPELTTISVCVCHQFSVYSEKKFTTLIYCECLHNLDISFMEYQMECKENQWEGNKQKKNETSEKPGFKSNEISNKAEINQMEQRKPSVMNQRFELVEDVDNLEYQTNCILHSYLLFSVQTCWKSVISQISLCKVLYLCMCLCMYVLSYKGFIEFPTNMFIWMCVHQPKMANGKWCDGRRWANE